MRTAPCAVEGAVWTDIQGLAAKARSAVVFASEVFIGLGVGIPLVGDFIFGENRVYWAFGLACSTVDALIRVDEHRQVKGAGLRLSLVNAFDRADIDAGGVFGVDAGFRDDVSHGALIQRKGVSHFPMPP
jgi:hypothetical protein